MLGRAIVLVREDQLSLAIGRRGQNVRLASKLCGWDIEIMTREELDEQIERAVGGFSGLDGVDENLAEKLVGEGFLSYDDLSVIEPDALMEMGGLTAEQAEHIAGQAEAKAEEAEQAAADERRRQRAQERLDAATAAAAAVEAAENPPPEEARACRRHRYRPAGGARRGRGDSGSDLGRRRKGRRNGVTWALSAKGPRRPGTGRRLDLARRRRAFDCVIQPRRSMRIKGRRYMN